MNSTQVNGVMEQAAGKVKQVVGDVTHNQGLANEGAAQQVKGHVTEAWGNVKDAAHEIQGNQASKVQANIDHAMEEMRVKMLDAAEHAKASINNAIEHLKH